MKVISINPVSGIPKKRKRAKNFSRHKDELCLSARRRVHNCCPLPEPRQPFHPNIKDRGSGFLEAWPTPQIAAVGLQLLCCGINGS